MPKKNGYSQLGSKKPEEEEDQHVVIDVNLIALDDAACNYLCFASKDGSEKRKIKIVGRKQDGGGTLYIQDSNGETLSKHGIDAFFPLHVRTPHCSFSCLHMCGA